MNRPDTRAMWEANAPAWIELSRAGFDVCRDLVNTPTFLSLLPPTAGLRCLDLGCGEGHNTRQVADGGGDVVALDISEVFIRAAAAADDGHGIRYLLGDGAVLPFRGASFDVVTAFMSLMDVADPERSLHEIARVLRPGGTLQFSVLHPVSSSPIRRWVTDAAGRREALAIGGYFDDEAPVEETWTFGAAPPEVREQHRPFTIAYAHLTVAGWFNAVLGVGLVLDAVAEPHADQATAAEHPDVADTRIAPYFLLVRARKP